MHHLRPFLLVALAGVLACGSGTGPGFKGNVVGSPETVQYTASLGVDLAQMTRSETGLYYQDLAVGGGDLAVEDRTVVVRYTGWLPNGRRFDSGQITAKLDGESLIAGFTEGIIGMRVGGRRLLVIPPELGYGNAEQGIIPAGAVLVFQVELLAVSAPEPEPDPEE